MGWLRKLYSSASFFIGAKMKISVTIKIEDDETTVTYDDIELKNLGKELSCAMSSAFHSVWISNLDHFDVNSFLAEFIDMSVGANALFGAAARVWSKAFELEGPDDFIIVLDKSVIEDSVNFLPRHHASRWTVGDVQEVRELCKETLIGE